MEIGLLFLLPICSALVCWTVGAKFSPYALIVAILGNCAVLLHGEKSEEWVWFRVADFELGSTVLIDQTSLQILFLVQWVGLMVVVFSASYMNEEKGKNRYFALVSLFVGAMNGLLIFKSLLFVFFFWQWVGFCSFWLIGFWYEDQFAAKAAQKAFLINKLGDGFLLSGIVLAHCHTGSFDYPDSGSAYGWWVWLILLGAVSKSAQLPFSIWLPDAMKGPTPVSALIHSATMVAAGVYLAIRVAPWIDEPLVLAYWGIITALLAALTTVFQTDIKKLLAYSTVSQLGLMFFALGLSASHAALQHLIAHGFFKAGLFLGAGFFMYHLHHLPQDQAQNIKNVANISAYFFWVKLAFSLCLVCLAGFPLTAGFFSKEQILEAAFESPLLLSLFLLLSAISSFYSFRLLFLIWAEKKTSQKPIKSIWYMKASVFILALASLGWWNFSSTLHLSSILLSLMSLFVGMIPAYLIRQKSLNVGLLDIFPYLNWLYIFVLRTSVFLSGIFVNFEKKALDKTFDLLASTHYVLSCFVRFIDTTLVDGITKLIEKLVVLLGSLLFPIENQKFQNYLLTCGFLVIVVLYYFMKN